MTPKQKQALVSFLRAVEQAARDLSTAGIFEIRRVYPQALNRIGIAAAATVKAFMEDR